MGGPSRTVDFATVFLSAAASNPVRVTENINFRSRDEALTYLVAIMPRDTRWSCSYDSRRMFRRDEDVVRVFPPRHSCGRSELRRHSRGRAELHLYPQWHVRVSQAPSGRVQCDSPSPQHHRCGRGALRSILYFAGRPRRNHCAHLGRVELRTKLRDHFRSGGFRWRARSACVPRPTLLRHEV